MTRYKLQVQPRRQYNIQYSNERGPQGPAGANGLGFTAIASGTILGNGLGDAALPQALNANATRTILGLSTFDAPTFAGLALTGKQSFSGTTHSGLCLHSLTTTEYNALTPANGDLFRDSTTDRIDARLARGTVELVDTAGGQTINGALTVGGTLLSTGQVRGASVWFGGVSQANVKLYGSATGQLFMYNSAETAGVMINVNGNSAVFRNVANNVDAPITCSNLTASGTVQGVGVHSLTNGFAVGNPPLAAASACLRTPNDYRILDDGNLRIDSGTTRILRLRTNLASVTTTSTLSTGVENMFELIHTINQTGTAGSTDFLINRTETALGSGAHNFVDFQRNSVSRLSISNFGTITTTGTIVFPGTAITKQITFGDVYNDGSSLQFLNGATAIATFNAATGISTGLGITASGTVTAQTALKIGTTVSAAPGLFPFTGATHTTPNTAGRGVALYSYVNAAESTSIAISGDSSAQTTGTNVHLLVQRVFTPTSGTGTYYFTELRPTVNQTGGANGITRGLFINPTLTAASDFRAIEIANCGSHKALVTGTGTVSFGDVVTAQSQIRVGTAVTNAPFIFAFSGSAYTSQDNAGRGLSFYSSVIGNDTISYAFSGNAVFPTSGNNFHLTVRRNFNPTSGSATYAWLYANPEVNQTGGASGVTRGVWVSPSLTAAADFRGIEVSNCGSHKAIVTGTGLVQLGDSVTITGNLTASGTLQVGGGTIVANILSATATLDFPSIATNDTHTLTITVTGAVAGDAVFLGVPAGLDAGLIFCASVTAADTVTVRMHNLSGGSVDPASGTFRATVMRF